MAERTSACLIFTSCVDVPSLASVDPKYLNWATYSSVFVFTHNDAVYENFAFVGADFHAVSSRCFLQSFSELFEFFTASIVAKLQIASCKAVVLR